MQASIHSLGGVQNSFSQSSTALWPWDAGRLCRGRALAGRTLAPAGLPPEGCSAQADIGRFRLLPQQVHTIVMHQQQRYDALCTHMFVQFDQAQMRGMTGNKT